jgi:ABC-type nitrate/sulfonate/bicarbonate transport system substrate-binding protein
MTLHARAIRRFIPVLAVATLAAVTACSSSSSGGSTTSAGSSASSAGSSASGGSGTASVGSLSVGVPGVSTISAVLYVAQEQGLYQQHHVTVNLVNAGATAGTQVAAGQLNVTQLGTTGAFAPTASGRQTSIIYWLAGNATAGVAVRTGSPLKPAATALQTLMELSGKRVAVQGTATSSSGNAAAFSKYIVAHGGKPLQIVNLPTVDAISAQLLSGQVDAEVGLPDYVAPAIAAGKARILVNASDPSIIQLGGGSVVAVSLWGLKSQLQSEQPAVTAFLAAIRQAQAWMASHSVSDIAAVLAKTSAFADFTTVAMEGTLKFDVPFNAPQGGYVDSASWSRSLKSFANWGLTQNLSSPEFSYAQAVDMSYWNAATKQLTGS